MMDSLCWKRKLADSFIHCVKSESIISLEVREGSKSNVRNPGRDISSRKEIETKRIRKEIKTIISRLNDFLCFLSNI